MHSEDHCNCSTHKALSVFTSRCLVAAFSGGRTPSSGFLNCPRPQLPAPHFSQLQLSTQVKVKSKFCYDRRSVGKSLLVSSTHRRLNTRFLLPSDSCEFVDVGRPLWRQYGYVVYNSWWPSPAQSFSGPNPAGLMTICFCLRFKTPATRRAKICYICTCVLFRTVS
jgi:hypothetical protein